MDIVRVNNLYDQYGVLLTEKQKLYFESYYFDDLSLAEIAENSNVSRNAVHKQIKEIETKLIDLEFKLGLLKINEGILELSTKIKDEKIKEELINIIR